MEENLDKHATDVVNEGLSQTKDEHATDVANEGSSKNLDKKRAVRGLGCGIILF